MTSKCVYFDGIHRDSCSEKKRTLFPKISLVFYDAIHSASCLMAFLRAQNSPSSAATWKCRFSHSVAFLAAISGNLSPGANYVNNMLPATLQNWRKILSQMVFDWSNAERFFPKLGLKVRQIHSKHWSHFPLVVKKNSCQKKTANSIKKGKIPKSALW